MNSAMLRHSWLRSGAIFLGVSWITGAQSVSVPLAITHTVEGVKISWTENLTQSIYSIQSSSDLAHWSWIATDAYYTISSSANFPRVLTIQPSGAVSYYRVQAFGLPQTPLTSGENQSDASALLATGQLPLQTFFEVETISTFTLNHLPVDGEDGQLMLVQNVDQEINAGTLVRRRGHGTLLDMSMKHW